MDDQITVERVRHAFVVGNSRVDGDAVALAEALAPERGRTAVVVGDSALDAVTGLDPWVLADIEDAVGGNLRVVAPGLAAMGPRHELPAGMLLAERLGVEVVVPDGTPSLLDDGALFVQGPGGSWLNYRPDAGRERSGPRLPAPWWQRRIPQELPGHVAQIPLGLWLRRPGGPDRPDDEIWLRAADLDRMHVVLGAPGEEPPAVADVVELLKVLPPEERDRAVLANYGVHGLAESVAGELGVPVRVAHRLPGACAAGQDRWRPFAVESVYLPDSPPVLDRWTAPVSSLPLVGPGSYRLAPGWRADVTASGLLVRPEHVSVDSALVADTGPDAILLLTADAPVADELIDALDELIDALPDDARRVLDIVPLNTIAAAAASRLRESDRVKAVSFPAQEVVAAVTIPSGAIVVTPDGRVLPAVPILACAPGEQGYEVPRPAAPAAGDGHATGTGSVTAGDTATARNSATAQDAATAVHAATAADSATGTGAARTVVAAPRQEAADSPELAEPVATGPGTEVAEDDDPAPATVLPPVGSSATIPPLTASTSTTAVPALVPRAPDAPPATGEPGPAEVEPNERPTGAGSPAIPVRAPFHRAAPPPVRPQAPSASAAPGPSVIGRPESDLAVSVSDLLPGAVASGHVRPVAAEPAAVRAEPSAAVGPVPAAPEQHPSGPTSTAPSQTEVPEPVTTDPLPPFADVPAEATPQGRAPVPGPVPSPVPVEVSADAMSTAQQRQRMRGQLGGRYDVAARAVTRLLSERPGLRGGAGDQAAVLAELAVVRVFAETPEIDADLDFHVCLAGGLRRLPTARGIVVVGLPAEAELSPGAQLRLPAPVVAAPVPAADVLAAEALIWSTRARRVDGLLDPGPDAAKVVLPGQSLLRVLAVRRSAVTRVLLAEEGTESEAVLERLSAAAVLRDVLLPATGEPPVPAWFVHQHNA